MAGNPPINRTEYWRYRIPDLRDARTSPEAGDGLIPELESLWIQRMSAKIQRLSIFLRNVSVGLTCSNSARPLVEHLKPRYCRLRLRRLRSVHAVACEGSRLNIGRVPMIIQPRSLSSALVAQLVPLVTNVLIQTFAAFPLTKFDSLMVPASGMHQRKGVRYSGR